MNDKIGQVLWVTINVYFQYMPCILLLQDFTFVIATLYYSHWYSWLILVINCNSEVRSSTNTNMYLSRIRTAHRLFTIYMQTRWMQTLSGCNPPSRCRPSRNADPPPSKRRPPVNKQTPMKTLHLFVISFAGGKYVSRAFWKRKLSQDRLPSG